MTRQRHPCSSVPSSQRLLCVRGTIFFGGILLLTTAVTRGDDRDVPASSFLPSPVDPETFAALKGQSPFLRSIGLSESLVVTGMARVEGGVFATLFDRETRQSYFLGKEVNPQGWQLLRIDGDESDLKSLTARIKIAGNDLVSIRYEKLPSKAFRKESSSKRSNKEGGGTGPHGGPDPGVLTPDQLADAKKGAQNYGDGFQADGYPDKPPAATVAKLSKLTPQQREAINVKMFEYRNRGLGLPERARIYEGLLDRAVQSQR